MTRCDYPRLFHKGKIMTSSNYKIASDIFAQLEGEANAQDGYAAFLDEHADVLVSEDVAILSEILADESNHTLKLIAMAKKYSGIAPSPDDLKETLEAIGKGV